MQRALQIGNAAPPILARAVGSAITQAMNFKETQHQQKKVSIEMTTLPAFRPDEYGNARIFLATQVAEMMGRKFEENDWAKVYCAAKRIPLGLWSNLSIDITHGNLGVEHKMICRPTHQANN